MGILDMRSFALVLAFVSTPAMAADQFDLVCTAKKVTERYRVDLARGEWCADKCERVVPISKVTTTTITLLSKEKQFASDYTVLKQVDRTTGEWTDVSFGGGFEGVNRKGRCEAASFSGFPATKF
ncbi:hypothetical protein CA223_06845 [Sphingomonas koreensis]|uniref:Uncharacterized protein n=2 Tax=Sphingomonas koreensis TaxID=93064 RepID=A0A1L6J832_9SPHN|nr:hypothetical protein BRX40_05635 [Sphingomonas koreensis]RSU22788.1 hypothetical protein CA224_05255 [Sphingomonas koreensis]RSU30738.1 hypothetical protein CA222_01290 [Sphingomonas koreensis]RSU31833.1 hypothetical protein CA225_00370 [Sphingomonas koreensis]RSU39246.1 hypothetical protein BRX39_01160 [Sphingomonas koreensis]